MDTLLTLIIAFGVIATGICAILAASTARRQGQVTERQAQLAEQSLSRIIHERLRKLSRERAMNFVPDAQKPSACGLSSTAP
jgi:type II secretory pathway pseudopilin PulG